MPTKWNDLPTDIQEMLLDLARGRAIKRPFLPMMVGLFRDAGIRHLDGTGGWLDGASGGPVGAAHSGVVAAMTAYFDAIMAVYEVEGPGGRLAARRPPVEAPLTAKDMKPDDWAPLKPLSVDGHDAVPGERALAKTDLLPANTLGGIIQRKMGLEGPKYHPTTAWRIRHLTIDGQWTLTQVSPKSMVSRGGKLSVDRYWYDCLRGANASKLEHFQKRKYHPCPERGTCWCRDAVYGVWMMAGDKGTWLQTGGHRGEWTAEEAEKKLEDARRRNPRGPAAFEIRVIDTPEWVDAWDVEVG